MRALLGGIWPARRVRLLGALLLAAGLVGPWAYLWQRARRYRPEPPEAVAVRPAMVVLPAGSFQQEGREVRLTKRFAISETEVTQENFQRVMGFNSSNHTGEADLPVEYVSWLEAVEYCNKLSEMEGLGACYEIHDEEVRWRQGCLGYRLPTGAEWEYAARADQQTTYAGSNNLDEVGWYDKNAQRRSHPVSRKAPNAWGLHDMSGNVWEWVWDWDGDPPAGPAADPSGPSKGHARVFRGGSWIFDDSYARLEKRGSAAPSYRVGHLGFRIAKSLP